MTGIRRPNDFLQERLILPFSFPVAGPTAGAAASGTVTADTNANMADADKVVISDGFRTVTYEYDKSANGVVAGNVAWAVGTTAASVATNLATAIAANQPGLSVSDNLAGVLTITNRWPGAGGNVTMTKTSASALAVTGMSGGLNPAATILVDTTVKLWKTSAGRTFRIDRAYLNLPTGLNQDAANYCIFKVLNGATIAASWSTLTGANGTLTADTPVDMVLGTGTALVLPASTDLSFFIDVTGTPTVPSGRVVVEGRYI